MEENFSEFIHIGEQIIENRYLLGTPNYGIVGELTRAAQDMDSVLPPGLPAHRARLEFVEDRGCFV